MTKTTSRRWPKVLLIVVVALSVLVVAGFQLLDAWLLKTARTQAANFGEKVGRKIELGGLATTLVSGLGVRVTVVSIGPGKGEAEPLLEIGRIEVKAALLQALTSRGKEVEIRSIEIEGLRVQVVKYPDGKTNLEHLTEALAESAPPEKKEEPAEKKPADLSFLRVDHFAFSEGRVAFADKSGAGAAAAKELAISHLALTIDDLRAGKPLSVLLSAAVLGEQKNFELRAVTEALSPTLQPVVHTVALKVQPIDLAPLAPFVPASVGLQAGRLDADFQADLGAAVPGGDGPTSLKGAVHALGLKFAGAQEGKPLDVTLETDVGADFDMGDADLRLLKLVLGPASITGQGKVSGLSSGAPKLEGLEVVAHDLDPAKLAAYYPPLAKQLKGQLAGPIGLSLRGSGTAAAQVLQLEVDLTPVKLDVPAQLSKAAGAKLTVSAKLRAAGAGKQGFEVKADLAGIDLRPGASLNKGPGDKLELSLSGHRTAGGTKAAPTQKLELTSWTLELLADALTGALTAELTGGAQKTTHYDLSLKCAHLDLDKLLIPGPKKEKAAKPPLDPKTFAGLSGLADVRFGTLVMSKQTIKNVIVTVKNLEDEIDLVAADLDALGGHVSAAGTRLKLAHPKEPFAAKLKLAGLDLEQAVKLGSDKKVLAGKLDADVDLRGTGQTKEAVEKSLAGTVNGKVIDGVFYGKDLIASASGPLAKALPFGLAGKEGAGGQTSLGKELPFGLLIKDGQATMTKPLQITRPEAVMTFTGGAIGLDGTLNLPGVVALSPATVATLTGGKAKVSQPVPIKLRVTGPATSPSVSDVELGDAVATLGKAAASSLIGGSVGGAVGNALGGLLGGGSKSPAPADEAKQKLEDTAKDKLKSLFGN